MIKNSKLSRFFLPVFTPIFCAIVFVVMFIAGNIFYHVSQYLIPVLSFLHFRVPCGTGE